jgi:hypothetical protein
MARDRFAEIENVGRENGFDFTRDEFEHAMRQRKASGTGVGVVKAADTISCQCPGDKDNETDDASGCVTSCQCPDDKDNETDDASGCVISCQCPDDKDKETDDAAACVTPTCQCPDEATDDTAEDVEDVTSCQCPKD